MALSVLDGFGFYMTKDEVKFTVVSIIYCQGKLVTEQVTNVTLDDDTYTLSVVEVYDNIVKITASKVIKKSGELSLHHTGVKDTDFLDELDNTFNMLNDKILNIILAQRLLG